MPNSNQVYSASKYN